MPTIEITQDDLDRLRLVDDICSGEGIGPNLDDLIERMAKALEAEG